MTFQTGGGLIPFRLKNIDGQMMASSDLAKGSKALAVIFSCNHCPYVQAWEDRMIHLGQSYQPREVAFVLINSNDPKKYAEDNFTGMVKRAQAKGYPFPYLHDEDQSVARAYGATRTPEVFLFDGQGMLRYHGAIDDNYENPDAVTSHHLKDALEALLSGGSPSPAETQPVGCTIKWKQ